jgi:hypothetical protein
MLGPTGVIFQHAAFGSESATSAAAFTALSPTDKNKVVGFLDSLGRREFDSNGDNVLDRIDLAAFRAARGGGPYTADDSQAVFDIDQNGAVDATDLHAFMQVYEEDCNGNHQNDLRDVVTGASIDVNGNLIPDECEHCQQSLGYAGGGTLTISVCGDDLAAVAPGAAALWVQNAPAGSAVCLVISPFAMPVQVLPNEWLVPAWPPTVFASGFVADPYGQFRMPVYGPGGASVSTWVLQAGAIDPFGFDLSNALTLQLAY